MRIQQERRDVSSPRARMEADTTARMRARAREDQLQLISAAPRVSKTATPGSHATGAAWVSP
jgi:hypothetical protein